MLQMDNATHQRVRSSQYLPIKVLIIESSSVMMQGVMVWLSQEGYECLAVGDGSQALELLQHEECHLLLCDMILPDMSGLDLFSQVETICPGLPVIVITGDDDRNIAVRALERGAYRYLLKPFTQNEVLIAVADALERARLLYVAQRTGDIHRRETEIIFRLVSSAEYHDKAAPLHIRRIGRSVALIGQRLGLPAETVENLRLAATMHDIGKIGIPDTVLLKPGKYTEADIEIMRTHTTLGAQILSGSDIPALRMAQEIAGMHHERWDGAGYPKGLAGEQIALCARIVTVVDVLDALMSNRSYRSAFSETDALRTMVAGKDNLFDPHVFDCMIEVYPELRNIRAAVS